MKIAVCLFVFCLGLILAVVAENNATANTAVGQIVKNINKVSSDKKKKIIKLGRKRKSEIKHLAKSSHKNIKNMIKSSNNYENLKTRALAAANITTSSAELILNLVNKTVDGLRKSLQEAGETVTELTKLYLLEMKDYADKCIKKIKENDIASVKNIYKNELLWISTITEASNRRITELVKTAAKSVSDLNHSGAVLALDTAEKQVRKLERLMAGDNKLQTFIEYASDKIYELSQRSADKYNELVTDCLKKLKELESKSEQALTTLTQMKIKTANETIEKAINPEHISPPMGQHIVGTMYHNGEIDEEFSKFKETISTFSINLMRDAAKTVAEIRVCKDDSNCKVALTASQE